MYFLASVTSQVPRTWNLKYLKTGSILSLLIVSFGFLTSKNLPIPNFKMKGWLGQYLQQKTWIQNGGFYPGTPILFKFLNLDNFGTVLSWGLNFSGIDHFNIIYKYWKNGQNLRGQGVIIQKYSMIWPGIMNYTQRNR